MLPMKLFIDGKNFTYIALADHYSYDATNVKNVVKICVSTWSIFAGPVTNMTQIDWVTFFLQVDSCLQEHSSYW